MLDAPWWLLLFAVIGVAATAAVVLTLFFEVGGRPGALEATEAPPVDSADFLEAVAGTTNAPLVKGGKATLLNNGDAAFPVILRDIADARQSINWMTYIFKEGRASEMVLDALTERARAGVEVRLLLDGIGGMNAPDEGIERFKAAGGKVGCFRPPRFGKLTRMHKRNHRRAIVIDGTTGFTGGMAVGDEWLGDADSPEHWRDSMVRVTGCLAGNLQSAFSQLWSEVTGEILVGERFYPIDPEPEEDENDGVSRHIHIISSPSDENHLLRRPFWLSFRCARERIWITSPYFVPDPGIRAVLAAQAQAGVDVRILLPGEHIDAPPIRWAAQHYYGELLEAGVRIWEYQPTMIHAKLLTVDSVWSIAGSANMDVRSQELNEEVILGILDHGFATELERTFLQDLERAKEIRAEEWCRRGWPLRLRSRACKILEEQY